MSETHAVIISIVGISAGGETFGDELRVLMSEIRALMPRAMPSFVPAAQPVSIMTHELLSAPEDRRRSPLVADAEYDVFMAARRLKDTLRGDGAGRCWCDAGAADRLRAAIEAWERFPE